MNEQLSLLQPRLAPKTMKVLALLQTGRKLSKKEIWQATGAWNVGDQCMKIKRAGYPVQCEMVKEGDNTFGRYFLAA